MNWWGTGGTVEPDGAAYHAIWPLLPVYSHERRSILQALRLAERAAELGNSQDVRFAGAVPERADVLGLPVHVYGVSELRVGRPA